MGGSSSASHRENILFQKLLSDFLLNLIEQNCITRPVLTAWVIQKETMCFSRLYSGGREKKNRFGIFCFNWP